MNMTFTEKELINLYGQCKKDEEILKECVADGDADWAEDVLKFIKKVEELIPGVEQGW